jgi:hypothetical protein
VNSMDSPFSRSATGFDLVRCFAAWGGPHGPNWIGTEGFELRSKGG